jgi:peroxiredoxin
MKINLISIMISLLVIYTGCNQQKEAFNRFSISQDTLYLKAEKVKGRGVFPIHATDLYFDSTNQSKFQLIFPKNISNIKIEIITIDIKPFCFEQHKSGNFNEYLCPILFNKNRADTLHFPALKDNSIFIMSGIRGKDSIFIADENNNKDFRDDSIRNFQVFDRYSTINLIKCKYKIYNGEKMIDDSSWFKIGIDPGDKSILYSTRQYFVSIFSIDSDTYKIGVADDRFCMDFPILALLPQEGVEKDFIKQGEYLKLKDSYYCFKDVTNDGRVITLVKEKDFEHKTGTQVGMLAPGFKCRTIDGDSVSLDDYKGKYFLIINVSSCRYPVSPYQCFKDITETYKNKISILGIDNSSKFLNKKIRELKLSGKFVIKMGENESIWQYRPDFCSRTCFLINSEGRIIDKFEIRDWESSLKKHNLN